MRAGTGNKKFFYMVLQLQANFCLGYDNSQSHNFVSHIFLVLFQSLLDEPNPNSPANSLAAQLYQENKREYEKKVTAIVEQSWTSWTLYCRRGQSVFVS